MKFSLTATTIISMASAVATTRADPVECFPQKNSTAPEPYSNTYDAFMEFALYREISSAALEPASYQVEFVNFIASIVSPSHIAFLDLNSYSPTACADLCDETIGFNVYFQRNPSLTPSVDCPNPKANVIARCELYSSFIYADQATNFGQFRGPEDSEGEAFPVAIRGSNGRYRQFVSFLNCILLTLCSGYNKHAATSDVTTITVSATLTALFTDGSTLTGNSIPFTTQAN